MKSKKAREYLMEVLQATVIFYREDPGKNILRLREAKHAVDLAELEAEERVRAELTRWHNPKEELPDTNRDVLIKTTSLLQYRIAFYKANAQRNYHWHENNGAIDDDMVIGWREIHE